MQPTRTRIIKKSGPVLIDDIGENIITLHKNQFPMWLAENKAKMDATTTKCINHRIRFFDGKERYKVHKLRGQYVLRKASPEDLVDKHDMVNEIMKLQAEVRELNMHMEWLEKFVKDPKGSEEEFATASMKPVKMMKI